MGVLELELEVEVEATDAVQAEPAEEVAPPAGTGEEDAPPASAPRMASLPADAAAVDCSGHRGDDLEPPRDRALSVEI